LRIGDRAIVAGGRPFVIAELGVNHDGSVERALELTKAAHAAGADAVKLQYFEAERLLSRAARLAEYQRRAGAADPLAMLKALELSLQDMERVVRLAHDLKMAAIVTVFSVELVEPAATLAWDASKVASPDIINRPLIEALIATDRVLLLSTGASTIEEAREAVDWMKGRPHILMQCVSAYPTPDERAALLGRHALMAVSPHALGYSDHTTAVDTGALAVASGVVVLEKHLTLDRQARGPDHAASLDPAGFREYVRLVHRARTMLGPVRKHVLDIEEDVRSVSRQSITASRPLAAGGVVAPSDVTFKRPGTGLSPALLDRVVGRRLARSVAADAPIVLEDVA
jgi:sialic acid synthase SpsE